MTDAETDRCGQLWRCEGDSRVFLAVQSAPYDGTEHTHLMLWYRPTTKAPPWNGERWLPESRLSATFGWERLA